MAAGGRLGRLDRLEAAALDRSVRRAAYDSGLRGHEIDEVAQFAARVTRFRRSGLGERAALARAMAEEGLSDDEVQAVLDDVERKLGRIR